MQQAEESNQAGVTNAGVKGRSSNKMGAVWNLNWSEITELQKSMHGVNS